MVYSAQSPNQRHFHRDLEQHHFRADRPGDEPLSDDEHHGSEDLMPGVVRAYTLVDVLGTIYNQTSQLSQQLAGSTPSIGIIGEADNTLIAYLAGVSRKLERPLAVIVQSASAAGK